MVSHVSTPLHEVSHVVSHDEVLIGTPYLVPHIRYTPYPVPHLHHVPYEYKRAERVWLRARAATKRKKGRKAWATEPQAGSERRCAVLAVRSASRGVAECLLAVACCWCLCIHCIISTPLHLIPHTSHHLPSRYNRAPRGWLCAAATRRPQKKARRHARKDRGKLRAAYSPCYSLGSV